MILIWIYEQLNRSKYLKGNLSLPDIFPDQGLDSDLKLQSHNLKVHHHRSKSEIFLNSLGINRFGPQLLYLMLRDFGQSGAKG